MKNIVKLLLCLIPLVASFQSVAGHVIVHPSNDSAMTTKDISRIYLGKSKKFSNGTSVVVLSQPNDSSASSTFNQTVLNKSNSQLKAYWSKLIFTGKGTPPKEVASDADVIKEVASNPNAIGYIASAATGDVKVLADF